jgi:murein DD-endopeptidase MepM/ murein hydrolase activator NlpD
VHSTGSGTVVKAGYQNEKNKKEGYGIRVTIAHGGGNTSTYGHLHDHSVHKGDKVREGQMIGHSGNTGHSTGPHLHYEERHNNQAHAPTFNPSSYRSKLTGREDRD